MEKEQLAPVAQHLLSAFADTADFSRRFKDRHHDMPPTVMAKTHYMRSVVQALIGDDESYRLSSHYAEFGRVGFTDLATGTELLLRSSAALRIETLQTDGQLALGIKITPVFVASGVQLLVYDFTTDGVKLSTVGTKLRGKRLVAAGIPTLVGFWPYAVEPDPDTEAAPFNQATRDDFDEVGDLGYDEEEGSSG